MRLNSDEIGRIRLILKQISFLEHLKMDEMDELIKALDKRPFRKNEKIITQGEAGETFYLLTSGTVGVYKKHGVFGSRKRVALLVEGAFFGEMALLSHTPRTASVIGEEDGEIYFLPRETFKKVLLHNPSIAALIQQTAAYRGAQNRALNL